MGRTIKRLSGLEIDEVSLVNRPANQHGVVAIAKAQEDAMPIYDDEDYELDPDLLEHGDVVYDENGTEFVFVDEEVDDGEGEYIDDYESELVGKSGPGTGAAIVSRTHRGSKQMAQVSGWGRGQVANARGTAANARAGAGKLRERGQTALTRQKRGWREGRRFGGNVAPYERQGIRSSFEAGYGGQTLGARAGLKASDIQAGAGRYAGQARGYAGEHKRLVGGVAGGSLAAVGAGGAGYSHYKKSLGDEVMEGLSKALTNEDRDEVIANAMDYMQGVAARNEDLEDVVYDMLAEQDADGYYELAKSYELPADPDEIAGIMYRASQTLPQRDLETLDRMFSTVSDVTKGYYDEIGYAGGYESDTMDQVYSAAGEAVAKSGASMSQEQAVVAMFQANPDAYDVYESEQARR